MNMKEIPKVSTIKIFNYCEKLIINGHKNRLSLFCLDGYYYSKNIYKKEKKNVSFPRTNKKISIKMLQLTNKERKKSLGCVFK